MIVDKIAYLNKMENLDVCIWVFGFAVDQENWVANIFKKYVVSNSMSEETRTSLKPVGTRSGIRNPNCNVLRYIVNFHHFKLFAQINTPAGRLRIFLQSFTKKI